MNLDHKVESIKWAPGGATSVSTEQGDFEGDSFFSSMPMRSLIRALDPPAPAEVLAAAERLFYRDYLTVVLILEVDSLFPDNWIYIHDPEVKVGRIQNYKNWSQEMVPDNGFTCLGLEYFCDVGDELWEMSDSELVELGIKELEQLELGTLDSLKDGTIVRMPKAYPVYDDCYQESVDTIRTFLADNISNLQPIGRNGMHKYNNQDHAIATGLLSSRTFLGSGNFDPWNVNIDAEYQESGPVL